MLTTLSLTQRDTSRSAAPLPGLAVGVALHRHDDVHVPTQPHPPLGPLVKVLLGGDGASDALLGADRPVLLEGAGAVDGGLVDTGGLEDLKGALVTGGEVALGGPGLVGGLEAQNVRVRLYK